MKIFFFGTDGGGWYIGPDGKRHPFPGWNPEVTVELGHAINILRRASQLKTPGLAEAATKSVNDFVQKELGAHLKEGGVLILS